MQKIVAHGLRSTLLAGAVILAALGCSGGGEESPEPAEDLTEVERQAIDALVDGVLQAYGGAEGLYAVRGYRMEGAITAMHDQTVGETVRYFQRPDRLRVELRYPDRGEVRIASGRQGWAGPDDRNLEPTLRPYVDSMRLQTARLDLPARLDEMRSILVLMESDERGRQVVRAFLDEGLTVDYHVDENTYRIEQVTMNLTGEDMDLSFRVELAEFRWVDGVLFPFKETIWAEGERTSEVRFRDVQVNPPLPWQLFDPGT